MGVGARPGPPCGKGSPTRTLHWGSVPRAGGQAEELCLSPEEQTLSCGSIAC